MSSFEPGLMPEDVRVDYWLDPKEDNGATIITTVQLDGEEMHFETSRAVYEEGKRIESSQNE
jgi:hypothetical protein